MNDFIEDKKNFYSHTIEWAFAAIFVSIASYYVFIREYEQGNYFYYFFKANFYYARFNKIIFPIGFWCFFLIYLGILRIIPKVGFKAPVKSSIYLGILFNIYLLIWTHWGEVVSNFSLIPFNLPYFTGKSNYERIIMSLALIFYYFYGWSILFANGKSMRVKGWQIIPLSFLLPLFLTTHAKSHFILLLTGAAIYSVRNKIYRSITWVVGTKEVVIPISIFLVGLVLRLWYASYFSFQGDDALGFSADGPAYFHSAVAFAEGRFKDIDYYHSPFYAMYLSIFMKLFGKSSITIYYLQAVTGSLTSLFIYFIALKLFNKNLAVLAGVLAAVSQIGVHHSVISHRIDPVLWILPAVLLLCLKKDERYPKLNGLSFGVLTATLFYLAQELLPTILTLTTLWFFKGFYNITYKTNWPKFLASFILGVFFTVTPLNLIFYSEYEKLIPLGRDTSKFTGSSSIGINASPAKKQLDGIKFNPISRPWGSVLIFIEDPIKTSSLMLSKVLSEAPGLLLDPGSIFFQPLILSKESFLGAHLQFYIYTSVIISN